VVHDEYKTKELIELKAQHPGAMILVHPESPRSVIKLADVVAFAGVGIGTAAEVIGAEILELGVGFLEEVPDDDEDGASDGDYGSVFAAAPGKPSVAFAQEGIRLSGHDRGLTQGPGQISGCRARSSRCPWSSRRRS